MDSIWLSPDLGEEIIRNTDIFEQTHNIVADIVSKRIDITSIVENMSAVLTNVEVDNRVKGICFFTKLLKELPKDYLTDMQLKFIANFYIDRLKDHHKVIPGVIEGYLSIIDMKNYDVTMSGQFFTILFREVACQSQVRQDRYNIYLIIKTLVEKNAAYIKTLGPDFIYGFISSMDGERDPRNLLFLFEFLPSFLSHIPLSHLVEEMFDVISCYYPVDFHPSPDDPAAVTRQELASALTPCLCAVPEFADICLPLLIEKLDSSLRLAKIDSLKLLKESTKIFTPQSYGAFLKQLWSSINRDINNKTDDELKLAAHEALSALVSRLATSVNTDQSFELFIKGILITCQSMITEATTVAQFIQASKIVLTSANASKDSCRMVTKSMIPATITYYGLKSSAKLQVASLDFMADMYSLVMHWDILESVHDEVKEIPQLCLTAVCSSIKEFQIAGFKTLVKVKNVLETDLVPPFIEVLMHNVQHSQDNDLLSVSVEAVHAIARKYPELIMTTVVKGKCDIANILHNKADLQKRLQLLSNLASIDEFTKIIIEEMLKIISSNDEEACVVVKALNESLSNIDLYSTNKISEIESDHGLVDSVITWLYKELDTSPEESLSNGFHLISNTISSLPSEKQVVILEKHTPSVLDKCKFDVRNFNIIHCLYSSIHQCVYNGYFEEIMDLSLRLALTDESEVIRIKACVVVAHFLNKADHGQKFELLYEILKNYLSSCSRHNTTLCPRLILLYGWIAKALLLRGSDLFQFWLQKVTVAISSLEYHKQGSDAIRIIMTEYPDYLNVKHHCRTSLLYKQRMFLTFTSLTEKFTDVNGEIKMAYLLSWAYILSKTPKTILNNEIDKISPILVDSLVCDDADLLTVMLDVLSHFIQTNHQIMLYSLQTVLPRLITLSNYVKSMDVRIKSLECLYEVSAACPTAWLLPHRQAAVRGLARALDDRKRRVRAAAVRARSRWFLVGAPGEDKRN